MSAFGPKLPCDLHRPMSDNADIAKCRFMTHSGSRAHLFHHLVGDDWTAYRDADAWLRDFADQRNIERGRVMCGGNWFTPQQIEAVRERARERATRAADLRPGSSSK